MEYYGKERILQSEIIKRALRGGEKGESELIFVTEGKGKERIRTGCLRTQSASGDWKKSC